MLWTVTVALAVMCVGGACNSVGADVMSRLILARNYRVKLCGREFIRAVIFTCGGSRWRRSTEGELDQFHSTPLSDVVPEDKWKTWQQGTDPRDDNSALPVPSSNSLADLLTFYRVTNERQQSSSSFPGLEQESTASGEQVENKHATDRLVARTVKRDISMGLAGMCCNQGCTKNDIGRLC
ncbi:prorelaxin H1 [Anableps anableps]